jgi:hypothetical protein
MTDYELAELFAATLSTLIEVVMAFISATSAFLIVIYLAGDELPLFLKNLITAIYFSSGLFFIMLFQRTITMEIDIRDQMGQSLSWHPGVYEPEWMLHGLMYLGLAIMILLMAGAIWYMLHTYKPEITNDK